MRVAVLSDTHGPRFWKSCPAPVARHLVRADVILHAGDICTASVLEELRQFAPVYAVKGNNDGADIEAPERFQVNLDGVALAMIHDSGPAAGRMTRLRQRFPDAACVVFGHSHIPMNVVDDTAAFRIFNPGSPTDKRRQPHKTMGLLTINSGSIVEASIIEVD